jgi:hypothetical protein
VATKELRLANGHLPFWRHPRPLPASKTKIGLHETLAPMLEQKLSPVLKPLFKVFKVSNLEDLIKRLLKLAFTVLLLIPMMLLPLYFFFFTLLHL